MAEEMRTGGLTGADILAVLREEARSTKKESKDAITFKFEEKGISELINKISGLSDKVKEYKSLISTNKLAHSKASMFTSQENAIVSLKQEWNKLVTEFKNKNIDFSSLGVEQQKEILKGSEQAKKMLRSANILEAITGDKSSIQNVSKEIFSVVSQMRSMPNFSEDFYNSSVKQYEKVFSILKDIQALGASNGMPNILNDIMGITPKIKTELQDIQELLTLSPSTSTGTSAENAIVEKAKANIKEVTDYINGLKKYITNNPNSLFDSIVFGKDGGIKTNAEFQAELDKMIENAKNKLDVAHTKNNYNALTDKQYNNIFKDVFKYLMVGDLFGLSSSYDMFQNDKFSFFGSFKEMFNSFRYGEKGFAGSLNKLNYDDYSGYIHIIENQEKLDAMKKNNGQDYIALLTEEKDLLQQIYDIKSRNKDAGNVDAHTLNIGTEEAKQRADALEKEREVVDKLIEKHKALYSNKDAQYLDSDSGSMWKLRDLETIKEKIDSDIHSYKMFKEIQLWDQQEIFENATDKTLNKRTNIPKELDTYWGKLEDSILKGSLSGEEAIEKFNAKAKELGVTFDEVQKKWVEITKENLPATTKNDSLNNKAVTFDSGQIKNLEADVTSFIETVSRLDNYKNADPQWLADYVDKIRNGEVNLSTALDEYKNKLATKMQEIAAEQERSKKNNEQAQLFTKEFGDVSNLGAEKLEKYNSILKEVSSGAISASDGIKQFNDVLNAIPDNKLSTTAIDGQNAIQAKAIQQYKVQRAPMLKKESAVDISSALSGQNGIQTEATALESLKNKILEVKNAIILKNTAFSQEAQIVSSSVQSEVNQLQLLHTHLKVILDTLQKLQALPVKLNITGLEGNINSQEQTFKTISELKNSLDGLNPEVLKNVGNMLQSLSIDESVATNIQKLSNAITNLKASLNNVSNSSFDFLSSIKELVNQGDSLANLVKVMEASKKEIQKAQEAAKQQSVANGASTSAVKIGDFTYAPNSTEWQDALNVLQKYSIELENISSLTRSVRQNKDGKLLESYKVTYANGSSQTLGLENGIVAQKDAIANADKVAQQYSSTLDKLITTESKAFKGDAVAIVDVEEVRKKVDELENELKRLHSLGIVTDETFNYLTVQRKNAAQSKIRDNEKSVIDNAYKENEAFDREKQKETATKSTNSYNEEIKLLEKINQLKIKNISANEADKAGNEKLIASLEEQLKQAREQRSRDGLTTKDGDEKIIKRKIELTRELKDAQDAYNASSAKQAELNNQNLNAQSKYTQSDIDTVKALFQGAKLGNATFDSFGKFDSSGKGTIKFIEQVGNQTKETIVHVNDLNDALNRLSNGTFDSKGLKQTYETKNVKDTSSKTSNTAREISDVEQAYKRLISNEIQYQKLRAAVDTNTATPKQIREFEVLTSIREQDNQKIREATGLTEAQVAAVEKLKNTYASKQNDGQVHYNANIALVNSNKEKYAAELANTKQLMEQAFNPNVSGFESIFKRAQTEVDALNQKLLQGNISNIQTGYTDKVNGIVAGLKDVVAVAPNIEEAQKAMFEYARTINDGNVKVGNFSKNGKELTATFKAQKSVVKEVALSFNETTGAITLLNKGTNTVKSTFASFGDSLKARFKSLTQYLLTFASFYRIWATIKQGVSYIRELDTALVEMRKVSDESVQSLKRFQDESFDIAKSVGTTAVQIQKSTADFMRLGKLRFV